MLQSKIFTKINLIKKLKILYKLYIYNLFYLLKFILVNIFNKS